MDIYKILILIGGAFGFLGACIAFLITWNEYSKHHFFRGKKLFMEAFKVWALTLVFFILLSATLAFVFSKLNI